MNRQQMIEAVMNRSPADSETLVADWLNEAYMKLAKVAKLYTEGTVTANSSTKLYSLPSGLIQLLAVKNAGKFLEKMDEEDTDEATGTPTYYYKRGNKLGFYPSPTTDTVIDISYYEYPDKLVNNTDEPVLAEEYHEAMVNYAISKAVETDDPDAETINTAVYYMNQFNQAKAELEKSINSEDSYPRRIKDVYWGYR